MKTAQPDGKHLVKKPVANVFNRAHASRNANNFAVGLRISESKQDFDSYSIVTIKLLRAQGGCHGTGRRRKTW